MIRSFKRLRRIVGRWDGSRQAPRRPSSRTPISPTPSSLMPGCSSNGIQQAGAPRHMLRLTAAARPRQNRKPHSPAHADRGFLHGWLSYAKQRPKPFTIPVVHAINWCTRKLPFASRRGRRKWSGWSHISCASSDFRRADARKFGTCRVSFRRYEHSARPPLVTSEQFSVHLEVS